MNTGLPGYCNKGIPVPRVLCHCCLTEKPHKFRVRVWGSYRTYRSSGYGYGSVTYITHRSSGYCGTGVQSLQKIRVRVIMSYRTYRSSGYGYECPAEFTEVLCRVIPGVNTRVWFCTCPTEYDLENFTVIGSTDCYTNLVCKS